MYKYKIIALFSFILLMTACAEKETETVAKSEFGNSINYDSFLWKEGKNDTLIKSFTYNFNQWASESSSFVKLTFNDEANHSISSSNTKYHFLVNGKPLQDGTIVLESKSKIADTLQIKLVFTSKINNDVYGYISLVDHNIDRVNDIDNLDHTAIYKWSASQEVKMNPLKNVFIWGAGVLTVLFILYLFLLRPMIYRRFGKGIITIQQPFYKNTNLRGVIELTFTNKKVAQSFFNRLLQGKKVYVVNEFFTTPLTLIPSVKGKVRIKTNGDYSIDPFTTSLEKGKTFKVTNTSTNNDLTITYL